MLLIVVEGLLALLVIEVLIYPLWMNDRRVSPLSSGKELKRIEEEIEQEILMLRKRDTSTL